VPAEQNGFTTDIARTTPPGNPENIAEWVRRFGAAYDYMIVLDADSLTGRRRDRPAGARDGTNPTAALSPDAAGYYQRA